MLQHKCLQHIKAQPPFFRNTKNYASSVAIKQAMYPDASLLLLIQYLLFRILKNTFSDHRRSFTLKFNDLCLLVPFNVSRSFTAININIVLVKLLKLSTFKNLKLLMQA